MTINNLQHLSNLVCELSGERNISMLNISSLNLPQPDGTRNSTADTGRYADTWYDEFIDLIYDTPDNVVSLTHEDATLVAYNFEICGKAYHLCAMLHECSHAEGVCIGNGHIANASELVAEWLGNTTLEEHAGSPITEFAMVA